MSVIDAGAHVNEDPRAWTALAEARPGWLRAEVRRPVARRDRRETLLASYVEHLGDPSLVYASDHPHWDSDFPGTVATVRGQDLPEATLVRLLGDNAMHLYGL